ncbi:CoA pyrophosphatase [Bacillus sp. FJAT-47783]|uniref:NUDIX hydrolase n=1 Tax=Bacillus sp. FJAT-47783 TaxID=2922712 RepID=UPI001FAB4799|nr:CoA pyrophosphatase [Bacillus sp. FJAT-47783]
MKKGHSSNYEEIKKIKGRDFFMMDDHFRKKVLKRIPKVLEEKSFQHFAIFVPLIKRNHEIHILFEVRAHHMRRQPGDVCFPGGKVDREDSSVKAAAIRETREELNVTNEVIKDVFPLDYIVSPFKTMFHLFAGTLTTSFETIHPNQDEVAEIFTVPFSFFQQTNPKTYQVEFIPKPADDFPFDLIPGGENYPWQVRGFDELFYEYEGRVIWGLTAKIVHHLTEVLEEP